jgi:flagellar biosynthetic protein FlhB
MADESADDRTEEATPERRQEFREKGQVAVSKEITSVFVLFAGVVFMSNYITYLTDEIKRIWITQFQQVGNLNLNPENFLHYFHRTFIEVIVLIIPLFVVTGVVATFVTFAQTRFNFSWKKISPDFTKMNPLSGIKRMVGLQSVVELLKGLLKMTIVGTASYIILISEWNKVPGLMLYSIPQIWGYWASITKTLFWTVTGLLLFVGALDLAYNIFEVEKKLKMTKQEVKEEYKKREVDPHVKAKIRRLQRDMAMQQMLEDTKSATAIITNPTHYSIAIKYELGMPSPIVIAKGVDFLALRIREVAKENEIPLVENKPLARTLFKMVEIGEEIPESLYKAVAEVIKYVFRLKGTKLRREG